MTVPLYNLVDTWNDALTVFTAVKMDVTNTASATGSKLFDLLVGGTSKFNVLATGVTTVKQGLQLDIDSPVLPGTTYASGIRLIMNNINSSNLDPGFSNIAGLGMEFTSWNCDNNYVSNAFGSATAKTSILPVSMFGEWHAAGQKFARAAVISSWGMGDSFISADRIVYASGPVAGDEGVGFTPTFNNISQTSEHPRYIVTAVTRTTLDTTTTQAITGSKVVQTVAVASTVGATIGDWVVVNQSMPSGGDLIEAVQLTGVGVGTISGIFRFNYVVGITIKPALVLTTNSLYEIGQQRLIVNLGGAGGVSYSTGQVISSVGAELFGAGAAWTNNMVGGDAFNIGAIAMTKDEYTGSNFSADPLRSWYQITGVVGANDLFIHSFSIAGDLSYRGSGSFPTNYEIRPAARVLYIDNANTKLICEYSTHTWNIPDVIECVACPYPDVHGLNYSVGAYSSGATMRRLLEIANSGARKFEGGFTVGGFYRPTGTDGGDIWGLGFGIKVTGAQSSIQIVAPAERGLEFLDGGGTFTDAAIYWNSNAQGINTNAYGGLRLSRSINTTAIGSFNSLVLHDQNDITIAPIGTLEVQLDDATHRGIVVVANAPSANLMEFRIGGGLHAGLEPTSSFFGRTIRGEALTLSDLGGQIPSPIEGMIAVVTDSTTVVWGATITGGSSNHVLAYYNGANWTVAGK